MTDSKTDTENTFHVDENEILAAKLEDAETPSYLVTTDPSEADSLGAFEELALTESEALDSTNDVE